MPKSILSSSCVKKSIDGDAGRSTAHLKLLTPSEDLSYLKSLRHRYVALWRVPVGGGRGAHDLRSQRAQHGHLLVGHLLRHDDDGAVALDGRHQRQANTWQKQQMLF